MDHSNAMTLVNQLVRIVRYRYSGQTAWGVVCGEGISPVDGEFATTGELLRSGAKALDAARSSDATVALSTVELLSPVTRNQQFICQGINYESHLHESGLSRSDLPFNTIFTKASSCISSPDAKIVRPSHVNLLDYEAELGFVISTDITSRTQITPENLHRFIAGVVIVNDVSARDVQLPQVQFYKGKSYRSFGPVGPYLTMIPAAMMSRIYDLRLQLRVNGRIRQDFYAREMIFKPHETIAELSALQDLYAGDLISTGTSSGVAAKAPGKAVMIFAKLFLSDTKKWEIFKKKGSVNPDYLRPGDQVETSVRTDDSAIDLGTQRNIVVAENAIEVC
jgi:2,4-didehydro-3-deoxy-L-rhamnonate hydrolase